MATTYTQAKATLDDIAQRVNAARKRAEGAYAAYTVAQAELAGLQGAYATFIADLDAAAAGTAWPQAVAQKAEKDQMITDFQALKTNIDATIVAIDGV